jgi:2-iminobutanoate/2-iminopropanoate deaminase
VPYPCGNTAEAAPRCRAARRLLEPAAPPHSCEEKVAMPKQIIQPAGLPNPGPNRAYSHGVRSGNLLFLAGQTGHDAAVKHGVSRLEAQTRRTFERMQTILEAAGGSLDNLVTMTVFITDMRYGDEFVRLRGEILQRDFPASALIGVSHLASPDALLEIQAIAALD